MNSRIKLHDLRPAALKRGEIGSPENCVLITVSGFEERARFFSERWLRELFPSPVKWMVIGFKEHPSELSRIANDAFYRGRGIEPYLLSSANYAGLKAYITSFLPNRGGKTRPPLSIHIDYSCMPRSWYCRLVAFLEYVLCDGDKVFFWYSTGEYPKSEYPTAGVSDFSVYSGSPRLNSRFRAHLFGLGFDRVRASAIYSVIDPQYLVCYYADPSAKPEYVERVEQDNEQILKDAQLIANVPLGDFCATFSRLCALSNEFLERGDVIFVPDGPKPLVLASSLVPEYLGKLGVVCFHVARRKSAWQPVEVTPTGDIVGFSFSIAKCDEE